MSRKLVLLPIGTALGVAVGVLLLRRRSAAKPASADAQPSPPEPPKKPPTESRMQLNGSMVIGSCQVQTGSGPVGNVIIRVGPSPLAMLLAGAVIGIVAHQLLLQRKGRVEQ